MHHIRYRVDTDKSFQVFIMNFTSKEKAIEFLNKPPANSKGFDYWNDYDERSEYGDCSQTQN
jgi:hypothetical protein